MNQELYLVTDQNANFELNWQIITALDLLN